MPAKYDTDLMRPVCDDCGAGKRWAAARRSPVWTRRQILEWNKHLRQIGLPALPVPPIEPSRSTP